MSEKMSPREKRIANMTHAEAQRAEAMRAKRAKLGAKRRARDAERAEAPAPNARDVAALRDIAQVNAEFVRASRTNLTGANLSGANLSGADLSGAILDGADLTGITYDAETRWPVGFTPPPSA